MNSGMTVLFVAMSNSIHTARWISQISDQGWDIHLFPSIDVRRLHSSLRNISVHEVIYTYQDYDNVDPSVRLQGIPLPNKNWVGRAKRLVKQNRPYHRIGQLKKVIEKVKPDIIHSMEIQHAGYLTADVYQRFKKDDFPPWIVTNWGSDIFLFGRLKHHKHRIRKVLENCEFYSCESYRDVKLAKEFGFVGEILPVIPNTGGFDFNLLPRLRQGGEISSRRLIMLKGYQGVFGRSLVGLRALERCADLLQDYEIVIYSAPHEVEIAAEIFSISTGIPVKIMPHDTTHLEILRLHGRARISIGLSISDGISTSFLEAIVMGSFPIQSNTGSCDEWIEDGETGFIVPPEDPEIVERAIRGAITNDVLVNKAAEINYKSAREKLDDQIIKPKVKEIYSTIISEC